MEANRLTESASEVATCGGTVVSQVVDTMGEINASSQKIVDIIRHVTCIMGDITTASQEQSAGIEQVRIAVGQIDTTTQQNAALVEELAATAEGLHEQADKLARTVGVFKLAQEKSALRQSGGLPQTRQAPALLAA